MQQLHDSVQRSAAPVGSKSQGLGLARTLLRQQWSPLPGQTILYPGEKLLTFKASTRGLQTLDSHLAPACEQTLA